MEKKQENTKNNIDKKASEKQENLPGKIAGLCKKSGAPVVWVHLLMLFFCTLFFPPLRAVSTLMEILLFVSTLLITYNCDEDRLNEFIQIIFVIGLFGVTEFIGKIRINSYDIIDDRLDAMVLKYCPIILLACFYLYFKRRKSKDFFIKPELPSLLPALIYILLAIPVIHEIPVWDGETYFFGKICKLAEKVDFYFTSIKSLCFSSHLSWCYGLIVAIGQFIMPGTIEGFHLVNIVLAAISGVYLYGLIRTIFPEVSKKVCVAGTSLYLLSPFVLGIIGFVNLDTPGIFFFVIMVSCYFQKKRVSEIMAAYLFVFTKEPCVVFLTAFAFAVLLIERNWKRIVSYVFVVMNFCLCFLGKNLFKTKKTDGSALIWAGSEMSEIKIDKNNIVTKIKQIFILNFNWVIVLFIAVVFAIFLIKFIKENSNKANSGKNVSLVKKYITLFKNQQEMSVSSLFKLNVIMVTVLLSGLAFNFVYYDFRHPRYVQLFSVIVLLIGVFAGIYQYQKLKFKIIYILGTFAFLGVLIVQTHVSIDPVSAKVFIANSQYGNPKLVCSMWKCMGDQTVYNREYSSYIKCLEKLLDEADYKRGTSVSFESSENIYFNMDVALYDLRKKRFVVSKNGDNKNVIKFRVDEDGANDKINKVIHICNIEEMPEGSEVVQYSSVKLAYYTTEIQGAKIAFD